MLKNTNMILMIIEKIIRNLPPYPICWFIYIYPIQDIQKLYPMIGKRYHLAISYISYTYPISSIALSLIYIYHNHWFSQIEIQAATPILGDFQMHPRWLHRAMASAKIIGESGCYTQKSWEKVYKYHNKY